MSSARPDVSLIRAHIEIINKLAEPVTGQGKLVIACFGEDPDQTHPSTGKPGCPLPPTVVHAEIGDVETTVQLICNLGTAEHRNIYMPLAVFRPDLPGGKKGYEKDIVALLGIVADFDDADAARWAERLPVPPSCVLETSAGRFQAFFLFDKPEPIDVVKPIASLLKPLLDATMALRIARMSGASAAR